MAVLKKKSWVKLGDCLKPVWFSDRSCFSPNETSFHFTRLCLERTRYVKVSTQTWKTYILISKLLTLQQEGSGFKPPSFVCRVCIFFPCLHGLCPSALVSSHSSKSKECRVANLATLKLPKCFVSLFSTAIGLKHLWNCVNCINSLPAFIN